MGFYEKINNICKKYNKVALFVDMDGTIVEFLVYPDGFITNETKEIFINAQPINIIIKELEKLNKIDNLEIYILTLSKSNIIKNEKKLWLKRHIPFVKESNYIIIDKENNEYSSETRDYIKCQKMKEKLNEYDYVMLLDDDHKILRTAQKELQNKGEVFHISSALI